LAKPAVEKAAKPPSPVAEQVAKASGAPVAEAERAEITDAKKTGVVDSAPTQAQPFPAATRHRHQTVDPEKRIQDIAAGRWEDPYDRKLDEAARAAARRANPMPVPPQAAASAATTAPAAESLQYAPSGFAVAPGPAASPPAPAKAAMAGPTDNRPADSARSANAAAEGNALSDDTKPARAKTRDSGTSEATASAAPQSVRSDKLEKDALPAQVPAPAAAVTSATGGLQREAPAAQSPEDKAKQRPHSDDPNANLYPEHWLANIRTMLHEHHRSEALHSLGEFRKMYPDYHLPDDLRALK